MSKVDSVFILTVLVPIEFVVAVVADVDLIMVASFDIVLYVVEVVGVLIEFEGFVVAI